MTISANTAMPGAYDYGEVARSVLIAMAASYVALDLTGRVTAAKGRVRVFWLSGGATAMGIGIWAMHFKGMLAFHLPVPVAYHWPTVLASLLVAVFASAVALLVASGRNMGRTEALIGSVIMGGAIAGMHYVGVASMRLPAITRFSPWLVISSILLAILFSLIALLMAFGLREETEWTFRRGFGSAVVMGVAISAMHYTGMAAASFIPASPPDLSRTVSISPLGNFGVALATLLVLSAAVITSSADRRAERKRAEDAVRRSERQLRNLIETIPTMVFSIRPDGSTEFVSRNWQEYAGLSLENTTGGGWQTTVHPDDLDTHLNKWRASLAGGQPFENEVRHRSANGEYRWFLVRAVPLCDEQGNVLRWYGILTDIEDRKRAEEDLCRSEAYLAEAQRLTGTGSWAWDPRSDRMLYCSEELYRIYGLDPQDLVPPVEVLLQRVHPEDRDRWREEQAMEIEYRLLLPDGTIKYVRCMRHPIFDGAGEIVEVIGTTVDVTERKHAEEERERLRQLEADLAHMNRVSMMGELAASLAHEIKQPIAAAATDAKTGVRWLQREPPDTAEAREALSRILKDVTRAAEIIDRNRSLYSRGAPKREMFNLNELIREMIVLLRDAANRHSISIHAELDPALPTSTADRVQMQQVLLNLMLNGIEAMKDTGGELTIRSKKTEKGEIRLSVGDVGIGLPAENTDRIFDAFFSTKAQGTGMGLSISRKIIESHGGRLWATANSGRGATFHFTVPAEVRAAETTLGRTGT